MTHALQRKNLNEAMLSARASMSLNDRLEEAKHYLASGLLPDSVKNPAQVLIITQQGAELGLLPMQSFSSIYVVKGKPTLSAQMMRGLVERSGQCEKFTVKEATEKSCTIVVKRKGRDEREVTMTREQCDQAKFSMNWDKDQSVWKVKDAWSKQPATMLEWRTTAKICRSEFGDVVMGLYTPDELGAEVTLDPITNNITSVQEPKVDVVTAPVVDGSEPSKTVADVVSKDEARAILQADDITDDEVKGFRLTSGKYSGLTLWELVSQGAGTTEKGASTIRWYIDNLRNLDAKTKRIYERVLEIAKREKVIR